MAKIKLAIVTPVHWSYAMGGAEYQMQQIEAALLHCPEVELRVLAGKVGPQAPDYVVSVGSEMRLAKYSRLFDWFRLSKALQAFSPTVVYQRVAGVYTSVAAAYQPALGYRLFWHLSSDSDVQYSALPYSVKWPVQQFERYLLRRYLANIDTVIAQTQPQQALAKSLIGERSSLVVVPNFHPEPTACAPVPTERAPESQVVLWVANLKPLKCPEKFIALARQFADQPQWRFVMIGALQSKAEHSQRWLEQIEQTRNLEYCGSLAQSEVNAWLSVAAVLINTSDYEGLPNTFIQAWMRGVPVLSLSVDPDGAMAQHAIGRACGSEAALAEALAALLTDADERSAMGERAKQFALAQYGQHNLDGLISRLISDDNA